METLSAASGKDELEVVSWWVLYDSLRTEGTKGRIGGFWSEKEAEDWLQNTETDFAVWQRLGWVKPTGIERKTDTFDVHGYADRIELPHKTVLFGMCLDEVLKRVAEIKGCELWVDEDHFDRYAVLKRPTDNFNFSRAPQRIV